MRNATDQAKRFIEALESDSTLQTQFTIASPSSMDGVMDFASGRGYNFTQEELEATLKHYPDHAIVRHLRQYVHH